MEFSGQLDASAVFTSGETAHGTHWIGGWVGPRAGLDIMEKGKISFSYQESNPYSLVVQPVLYRLNCAVSTIKIYHQTQFQDFMTS
jgi:hypothetical protein